VDATARKFFVPRALNYAGSLQLQLKFGAYQTLQINMADDAEQVILSI
jgi:hypothetical protein